MASQEKDQKVRPKGAMSAYAYFVQVIREEHKRKHPGEQVVFSEFSKKCAEKWKLMTPKEKKRFEEMSNNDKDRFNKEMNTFQPVGEGGRKRRKRRRIKEPGQPKRAWSAFFFFCDEFRPKIRELHPDWRVGNIAKELGRLWESCTDKLKYEKQSETDKQRYEEEMSQFRAGHFVPPVKRPREDSNGGAALAGSSSTEDPTIIPNDVVVNDDEEEEEEFDDGDDSENGLDNIDNGKSAENNTVMSMKQPQARSQSNKKDRYNSVKVSHESLSDGAISTHLNPDFVRSKNVLEGSSNG